MAIEIRRSRHGKRMVCIRTKVGDLQDIIISTTYDGMSKSGVLVLAEYAEFDIHHPPAYSTIEELSRTGNVVLIHLTNKEICDKMIEKINNIKNYYLDSSF